MRVIRGESGRGPGPTVFAKGVLRLGPPISPFADGAYSIIYAPNEIRVLRWNAKNVPKTVFHLDPSGG